MNIVLLEFLKGIGERKHILSDVMTELQKGLGMVAA